MMKFGKIMRDRSKDIDFIKRALPRLSLELMSQRRYFPVMFLMEAATTYTYGFDVASIFYSSLSVEMGLLIRVDEKLEGVSDEDKKRLRKLKNLIETASELKIIDEKHKEIAHSIRKLRNCYIHYYNVIHCLPVPSLPPNLPEKLTILIEKNPKLMKEFEFVAPKVMKAMEALEKGKPICSWAASPEATEFMKERQEKYLNWYFEELEKNPSQVFDQLKHMGEIIYPRYDQKRCDALDMIKWCFEMLKHLKFLD
jgi:hypothetical protein